MPRLHHLLTGGVLSDKALVSQLSSMGIITVEDLLSLDIGWLSGQLKTNDGSISKLFDIVSKHCAPLRRTGRQLYQQLTERACYLPTGSQDFDNILLQGGFITGEIAELSGPSGSGKTQICLTTAVRVAREFEGTVAFFDSGSSLSPRRLEEICGASSENFDRTLNRIRLFLVADALQLSQNGNYSDGSQIPGITADIIQFAGRLKLVVVDSFGTLFSSALGWEQRHSSGKRRADGEGRSVHGPSRPVAGGLGYAQLESSVCSLQEEFYFLKCLLAKFWYQRIMHKYHVAVLLTNTTTSMNDWLWPDYKARALGWHWPSSPSVSIYLTQDTSGCRVGRIRKSFRARIGDAAIFAVGPAGISNAEIRGSEVSDESEIQE